MMMSDSDRVSALERDPERRCPVSEKTNESGGCFARSGLHLIMAEDSSSSVSAGEVSRFNSAAVRGPKGIWNEHVLPIVQWEAAGHRVVVPLHLQQALGFEAPVLRWSKEKRRDVLATHRQVIEQIYLADVASFLNAWMYAGPHLGAGAAGEYSCWMKSDGAWLSLDGMKEEA
jgi:hypothetical protein